MELQLVTKEQALLLKEVGFDIKTEKCHVKVGGHTEYSNHVMNSDTVPYYADGCSYLYLPTIALALKWLREERKIWISIFHRNLTYYKQALTRSTLPIDIKWSNNVDFRNGIFYHTYEQAESNALNHSLLALIKQQNDKNNIKGS